MTPDPPAAEWLPADAPLLLCGAFGSFDRATGNGHPYPISFHD